MEQSIHYVLELQLKHDKKKWYVFAQGISPLFYSLQDVQHFHIYKQWLEDSEYKKKRITWKLVAFQQLYRRWRQFRKAVFANLRKFPTGEVSLQQLKLKYL